MKGALIRCYFLRFTLVAILVAVYFSSLSFDWLEIEDGNYYLRNPLFQEGSFFRRLLAAWFIAPENNWIPGTWSLAIILHQFFDFDALVFRSFSLILHAINTLLVIELARRLSDQRLLALFAGVVFALHPIQVESVVWISSLKGLLSVCFALLSIYVVLLEQFKWRYWISCLLFAIALTCKQDVIGLPVILFLLFRLKSIEHDWPKIIPHAFLSVLASILAFLVNQGNTNPASPTAVVDQLTRPFSAAGHYLLKWGFPLNLHPEYRLEASSSFVTLIIGGVAFVAVFWIVVKLWKNPKSIKLFDASCVSILIAIVPFLGWFPSPLEFASDRLLYFSSIFLSLSTAIILSSFNKRSSFTYSLIVVSSIVLSILTVKQIAHWETDRSLCDLCLEHDSKHYLSRINLGLVHARAERFVEAEKHLLQVVQDHPARVQGWIELAKVSLVKGDIQQAEMIVEQGLSKHPGNVHLKQISEDID